MLHLRPPNRAILRDNTAVGTFVKSNAKTALRIQYQYFGFVTGHSRKIVNIELAITANRLRSSPYISLQLALHGLAILMCQIVKDHFNAEIAKIARKIRSGRQCNNPDFIRVINPYPQQILISPAFFAFSAFKKGWKVMSYLENRAFARKPCRSWKVMSYRENHVESGKLVFTQTEFDAKLTTCTKIAFAA